MPARLDLTGLPGKPLASDQAPAIYRGDDEEITIIVQEDDVPIDITDRVYNAQIRTTADSEAILASFTCEVTDAVGGEVVCTLSSEDSELLPPGNATWDLEEDHLGVITTIIAGKVKVIGDVTRDEVIIP